MAPKPTTAERRMALLRDTDVRAWHKDHAKPATAAVQLDQLEIFLRRSGLSLGELVALAKRDPKGLKGRVGDFIRSEQAAGRKAKYVLNVWWGVRSFLKSIDAAPEWNPKVERTEADEEDTARTVPTHDELRQIVNAVKSARDRAVVYLLASSGVRVGVLATQYAPADGLRLKHLPDLDLTAEPKFRSVPFAIRIPSHLSKGKNAYYSFGSREAADAVVAMLKERARDGETLSPESPLVLPETRGRLSERRAKDGASFMVRKALAERIKIAMARVSPPGSRWSAHTLRAWFSTQMETCESRGLISRTRREFFAGHALGVDGAYNLNRPLPPEKIEELRESYAKCEGALLTSPTDARALSEARDEIVRELARLLKVSPKETEGLTPEEKAAVVLRKIGASVSAPVPPAERIVDSVEEARRLMAERWTYVGPLGSGAVLRAPAMAARAAGPTADGAS